MKKKKHKAADSTPEEKEKRLPGWNNPDGGFCVPDGYFKHLPDRIRERILENDQVVIRNRRHYWAGIAVAAGFLILVAMALTLYFIPVINDRLSQSILTDTTSVVYEEYILGNVDESALLEVILNVKHENDTIQVADVTGRIRLNGFEVPMEDVIDYLVAEEISNDLITETREYKP